MRHDRSPDNADGDIERRLVGQTGYESRHQFAHFRFGQHHFHQKGYADNADQSQNEGLHDPHAAMDQEQEKKRVQKGQQYPPQQRQSEQQLQAEMIKEHYDNCKYPKIICGDMNNSAFSYVYRTIKGDMKDAFEMAGTGFGKSYNFDFYPARIDYIFTENDFKIKEFKNNTKVKLSDHFPIYTRVSLEK